jgi:hypothetical protein
MRTLIRWVLIGVGVLLVFVSFSPISLGVELKSFFTIAGIICFLVGVGKRNLVRLGNIIEKPLTPEERAERERLKQIREEGKAFGEGVKEGMGEEDTEEFSKDAFRSPVVEYFNESSGTKRRKRR